MADDLSGFTQIVKEEKASQPVEPIEDEPVEYSLNPAITIPEDRFRQELAKLVSWIQQSGKMNLASAIKEGNNQILHNRWTLEVANDVLLQIVKRETDLLPRMRSNLEVNELFMDLRVDPKLVTQSSDKPYTEEQKLKVMSEENDALKRLQEIFKTRIIY